MTTLTILQQIRELLSDEKRWTKEASARDSKGISVNPNRLRAVRWCLHGACTKVARDLPDNSDVIRMLDDEAKAMFPDRNKYGVNLHFILVNDHPDTTHADVIKVLDKAIERAKEGQK